jgi:hypothetical protein
VHKLAGPARFGRPAQRTSTTARAAQEPVHANNANYLFEGAWNHFLADSCVDTRLAAGGCDHGIQI